jgi:hypothetical protein
MSPTTSLGYLRCPRCISPYVYLSQRHDIFERFMRGVNLLPYRCGDCDKRYYVRGKNARLLEGTAARSPVSATDPGSASRRPANLGSHVNRSSRSRR